MKILLIMLGIFLTCGQVFAQCDPSEKIIRFALDSDTSHRARDRAVTLLRDTLNREMQGKACLLIMRDDALYKGRLGMVALQSAKVELAAPSFRTIGDFAREYRVFDLPFAFRDILSLERFLTAASAQLSESLVANGVVPLNFLNSHFRQISAKVPIYSPENVAGLKFRSDNAKFFWEQTSALKAISIPVTENDVSVALKTARISAQVSNWEQLQADKTAEITDGVTETNHTFYGYHLIASSAWWSGLEPAFAKQLKELFNRTSRQSNFDAAARETNAKRAVMRSGVAVRTLTRKQRRKWREKLAYIWDGFANGNERLVKLLKASDIGL